MCIVMCIALFFDNKFSFKISVVCLFVGSYYRTILNSSLVYLNQRKARMLWLLAHIYLLLSTGIKLLLGGISGGTIVGCIILNAFKILNVSGSF